MTAPLQLVLGFHLHQPVGNFDHVFREHSEQVYAPLLSALGDAQVGPFALHVSGPLLEWMLAHDPVRVAQIATLVDAGRIDLWCAGMYEPILATLSPDDRRQQLEWHQAWLAEHFGVRATGTWLTERVWEPDLPTAFAATGVRYAVVDDRHFLAAGLSRAQLDRPWRTEHDSATVDLLPIDERLRYLIPFRPWSEIETFLRAERDAGRRLAVFADDGEKFGGWPGTAQWVWRDGWMRAFLEGLAELSQAGVVQLVRGDHAVRDIAHGGLCYLPTASYREMEHWALPPAAAQRLETLEADLGAARMNGADGALVRGTHWRSFLAKYPESNRLHKMAQRLSRLARERGDPPAARRAIARAQCNDALWHGVFGGLYLPFLRRALWSELARAEQILRAGEALAWEVADVDADGADEILIHSATVSVLIAPARGAAIEMYSLLDRAENLADTLTRRIEAYHHTAVAAPPTGHDAQPTEGTASIHDLERVLVLSALPPADRVPRGIGVERFVGADVVEATWVQGSDLPLPVWQGRLPFVVEAEGDAVRVVVRGTQLEKSVAVGADGRLTLSYVWDPAVHEAADRFAVELSVSAPVDIEAPGARVWHYEIETVAKSERGFDRTRQGSAVVVEWPVARGHGSLRMRAG